MSKDQTREEILFMKRRELLEALMQQQQSAGQSDARIPRRKVPGPVPLSFAQKRLWFLDQYYPGSPLYNVPATFPLYGPLHAQSIKASLNEIIRRHESLRTSFVVIDGKPMQVVAPSLELDVPLIDLSHYPEEQRLQLAGEVIEKEAKQTFDLVKGPLLHAVLVRLWDQFHYLLLTMHHIISDAWSMGVFIKEFNLISKALYSNERPPLPELPIQYPDFALWQHNWMQGEELQSHLSYWKKQLEGISNEILEMPTDRPRPSHLYFSGATVFFTLPRKLSEKIMAVTQQARITPFMTLLAGFKALLFRYTDQSSIIVGVPMANRNRTETENLIGFFVNSLVLRTKISPGLSFQRLLEDVREVVLGAFAHQDLPFEKLVEELQPARSLNRNPLFQIVFDYQNQPPALGAAPQPDLSQIGEQSQGEDKGVQVPSNGTNTSKFDLSLSMMNAGGQFRGSFEYSTDLFDQSTIIRLIGHFETLLDGMVHEPERPISDLPLMTRAEWQQVIHDWNSSAIPVPAGLCVDEQFEKQVRLTPQAVAVSFDGRQMTYLELNQYANRLARYLRSIGVRAESIVGICMEAGLELAGAILGVLKAGGAYLPLDAGYPSERLSFMLEDAGVELVLTQGELVSKLAEQGSRKVVAVDEEWERVREYSGEDMGRNSESRNACYVIYTSGSTGKPKGIVIEHRSVVNLVEGLKEIYGIGEGRRVLQFASLSFDQSVREVFETLLGGATLCLVRREEKVPGEPLLDTLRKHRITDVTIAPSILAHTPDAALPDIKTLSTGGEACWSALVNRWAPGRRFFNIYGPSEITFSSSICQCFPGNEKPKIGGPLPNVRYYVVDEQMQPCIIGKPGELLIGGVGLARAYQRRAELTAERFIPDWLSGRSGERLYRTGDLVKWTATGNVEYIGRIDRQVKVRGFRIELGEVEAVLSGHEGVSAAVVVCQGEMNDQQLVAYVVSKWERVGSEELKRYLSRRLPEYMVPQVYVDMEEMPLSESGKVDHGRLPSLEEVRKGKVYEKPGNEVEEAIAEIWKKVLNVERVGVNDNFFELGGSSLNMTMLSSLIRDEFKIKVPLSFVLENQTVAEMVGFITANKKELTGNSGVVLLRKAAGNSRDLFFIHDSSGSVEALLPLSRHLSPDINVWGIQSDDAESFELPRYSIEEMAQTYIKRMRAVKGQGRWLVGGWSFGAVVAFEVARQLNASHEKLSPVIVIDMPAPNRQRSGDLLASFASLMRKAFPQASSEAVRARDKGDECYLLLNRIAQFDGALERLETAMPEPIKQAVARRREPGPGHLLAMTKRIVSQIASLARYQPEGRPGIAVEDLRAASRGEPESADEWESFTSGTVRRYVLDGDHWSILTEPKVSKLAKAINQTLSI